MSRRAFLGAGLAGAAGLTVLGRTATAGATRTAGGAHTAGATTGSNCFSAADNSQLNGLRVMQLAAPPDDNTDDPGFLYWPATDFATRVDFGDSTWSGNKWHFVWANRANTGPNQNPNPIQPPIIRASNGAECRMEYSSIALANAATQSFIRYTLGISNYQAPWVAAGGSATDFRTYDQLAASPDTYFTTAVTFHDIDYQVAIDRPWTPSFRLVDVAPVTTGIFLDYEVADGRSLMETTDFIQDVADDVHSVGKKLLLFTDPLDGGSQHNTGLTADNLPALSQSYVDYTSVYLDRVAQPDGFPAAYDSQLDVLRGPNGTEPIDYSRLSVTFRADSSADNDDAQDVYDIMHGTNAPPLLTFIGNTTTSGGSCSTATNQKVAIACFGNTRP